jgi:uncharacterized protein (TIGR02217 family)
MSGFHDVLFPLRLARGAVGGPHRRTDVITLANGREVRIAALSGSRRRWEVASAMIDRAALAEITAFFEARLGRLHGFRFRDPGDSSSAPTGGAPSPGDQRIGTGDGSTRTFQLVKRYGDEAGGSLRAIQLPWPGSVVVAVDGVVLAPVAWTLTPRGGLVTLTSAPVAGAPVTAGFRFDCAARFDTDTLDIAMDAFDAGRTLSVPLMEIAL